MKNILNNPSNNSLCTDIIKNNDASLNSNCSLKDNKIYKNKYNLYKITINNNNINTEGLDFFDYAQNVYDLIKNSNNMLINYFKINNKYVKLITNNYIYNYIFNILFENKFEPEYENIDITLYLCYYDIEEHILTNDKFKIFISIGRISPYFIFHEFKNFINELYNLNINDNLFVINNSIINNYYNLTPYLTKYNFIGNISIKDKNIYTIFNGNIINNNYDYLSYDKYALNLIYSTNYDYLCFKNIKNNFNCINFIYVLYDSKSYLPKFFKCHQEFMEKLCDKNIMNIINININNNDIKYDKYKHDNKNIYLNTFFNFFVITLNNLNKNNISDNLYFNKVLNYINSKLSFEYDNYEGILIPNRFIEMNNYDKIKTKKFIDYIYLDCVTLE